MPAHQAAPNIPLPLVLLIAATLIVIDLWVATRFLDDLYKPERRVVGGNKDVWAVIIVVGSIVGMMAYLLIGREN